jgi:hypothetical protein
MIESYRSTQGLLIVAAFLVVSCGGAGGEAPQPAAAPAPGPPEQPEGHRRMVNLLAEIAETAAGDNPYLGERKIPQARLDLAALPESEIPKRWFLNVYLGKQELRVGREDMALEHYREANRLIGESPDLPPLDKRVKTLFETAVALIRRAESRNWVDNPDAESNLFPIRGGGVHAEKEDSRVAIDYLMKVLELTESLEANHLRARWLLNIAYMMQGEYPEEVPSVYLLPLELFESDEPFPRFENVAPRLGVNSFDLAGGAIVEDFNGDGNLDIMVSTMHTAGQMRLYVSDGEGGYSERTIEAGLEGMFGGLNMIDADYDNDGDVDVYVLRGGWFRQFGLHPNSLLRNDGDAVFTDVTFEAGLQDSRFPTQTAAWGDYDNDGDLDLYVGNESGTTVVFDDAGEWKGGAPCQLFRNNGDGTFVDVAAAAGVENLRYAKGVVWGDYDGDRFLDLYVSNNGSVNRLYHNNRDGTFTDVAKELGVSRPISSFAVWFWDVNNDGALDLFVTAYGGPNVAPDVVSIAAGCLGVVYRNETSRVYVADGQGGFRDMGVPWGLADVTLPMGANFGDLDNDGYLDFYLGTGYPYYEGLMPNVMYRNQGGNGLADVTTAGGFGHLQKGHGIAFAALDNDGDQDVYAQVGGAFAGDAAGNALFENPGFGNHWIKVKLIGVRSNRSAIGARLRVDIVEGGKSRSIYRRVDTGGSFGASPFLREIGLGQAERIELLEVYWPTSDETQRFRDVAMDQRIEITEGQSDYRKQPLRKMSFKTD